MQLFSGGNTKKDKILPNKVSTEFIEGYISSFRVLILSRRTAITDNIRSILFLYNVISIEVLALDIDQLKENPRWGEFDVCIIDIDGSDNAEEITSIINRVIPIKSTIIAVGSNDSIIFADLLSKKGIHFLLENKQLEQIPTILLSRSTNTMGTSKRIGSVITFLGCKAGIGTSSLIINILKNISQSTSYPILYVQGASTSANADFLFETPVDKSGALTSVAKSVLVKIEQEAEIGKPDFLDSDSFNITIFDQNIGLRSCFSQLENMVTLSNIVFFIINRDPYSIKVAKDALDEVARMGQKNSAILSKRFLLCVNENKPFDKKSVLHDEDIEEYIGRSIDFSIKFIPNGEKLKKAFNSPEFKNITSAVIGVEKKQPSQSLFSFMNKKRKAKKIS